MVIDYEKAKNRFASYVSNYDLNDSKIRLKKTHTYGVVSMSEYIAKDLNLSEEDIELAKLIGLLHDIGRFEQAKLFSSFNDSKTMNHALYGAQILFDDGLIREFIEADIYDEIIKKAILNHNKYAIDDGLNERELLHAKIIRDADKTDNFRVKAEEEFEAVNNNFSKEALESDEITAKVYETFMEKKSIVNKDRKTSVDMWISHLAFIFDYNFISGLKYIKEKDYINILVERVNYQNPITKKKMENIRSFAIEYIKEQIDKEKRCF